MLGGELAVPYTRNPPYAGPNAFRGFAGLVSVCLKVLRIESCAMGTCEPGQVREEAAISKHSRVPRGRSVWAGWQIRPGCQCRRRMHGVSSMYHAYHLL